MERTTNADVYYAFREWLALTKHRAAKSPRDVGGYRIGHDGYGRTRIEKVVNRSGGIHVVSPGMSPRQFVEAVQFLANSTRRGTQLKNNPFVHNRTGKVAKGELVVFPGEDGGDADGIGVLVKPDGTVTNRWGDGTAGLPDYIRGMAGDETEALDPQTKELYVWRHPVKRNRTRRNPLGEGYSGLLLAAGVGLLAWVLLRNKGTTPAATWEARIAQATSVAQMEDIRFGQTGFETAYFAGTLDYAEYLRIFDLYAQKRNSL